MDKLNDEDRQIAERVLEQALIDGRLDEAQVRRHLQRAHYIPRYSMRATAIVQAVKASRRAGEMPGDVQAARRQKQIEQLIAEGYSPEEARRFSRTLK